MVEELRTVDLANGEALVHRLLAVVRDRTATISPLAGAS